MADAMQKSKTSLQAAPAITGPPPAQAQADYSPATVVAANKFKRFLGRHLAGSPVPGNQGKPISISRDSLRNLTNFTPGRWRGRWALCSQ